MNASFADSAALSTSHLMQLNLNSRLGKQIPGTSQSREANSYGRLEPVSETQKLLDKQPTLGSRDHDYALVFEKIKKE